MSWPYFKKLPSHSLRMQGSDSNKQEMLITKYFVPKEKNDALKVGGNKSQRSGIPFRFVRNEKQNVNFTSVVRELSSDKRSENGFSVTSANANSQNVEVQNGKQEISGNTFGNGEEGDIEKRNEVNNFRLFSGTIERILKWVKVYKQFAYYEVIAPIISIQEGTVKLQKLLLLKNSKGPILQVVYYVNDHINIDNIYVGQTLRCVGRMIGLNILHAFTIRAATPDEVATFQRLCCISDHAVSRYLNYS